MSRQPKSVRPPRPWDAGDAGMSTAEYATVLLCTLRTHRFYQDKRGIS